MHIFLFIFVLSYGVLGFSSCIHAKEVPPLQSLIQGIIGVDADTPALKQVTATAVQLEEEINRNTAQLKASVDAKAEELKQQAKAESERIFERYAHEAERLQASVVEETRALRRTAAERILDIATRAEEEALKAKQQARREFLEKKLAGSQSGEDEAWKDQLKAEFASTIDYLKQIIQQGETPTEADDFIKRFDAQATWFDNMLAATQAMTDPGYYQLYQKKEALGNIVDAQKKAEAVLNERYKKSPDDQDYKKMRLVTLYEINDLAQHKSGDGVTAVASTNLSQEDIDSVINKVVNPAKHTLSAMNVPAPVQKQVSQESDKIVALVEKLEQGKEAVINLVQKTSQDTQQAIASAARQTALDTSRNVTQALRPQFEDLSKDQLDLHSIILSVDQGISALRRMQDTLMYLDVKKTLMTEKEPTPKSLEVKPMATAATMITQEASNRQSLEAELELMKNRALSPKL